MNLARAFTIIVIIGAFGLPSANGQSLVMPKELVEIAKSRSCEPLIDFFDREGLVDPPYALGYLLGSRDASAVFYCRRAREEILLMVAILDNRSKLSCPTEIPYPGSSGGLRIFHGKRVPLNQFRYMEPPHRYGPKSEFTRGPIIESYYDGVRDWFYCHNGKWLRQFWH